MIEFILNWSAFGIIIVILYVAIVDNSFFYEEIMSIKRDELWKEILVRGAAIAFVLIIFSMIWPAMVLVGYERWRGR